MALVTFVDDNPPYLNAQNLNNNFNEVATGIAEIGSNANGNYIKWNNGLLICYKSIPNSSLTNQSYHGYIGTWAYPSTYLETPCVVATTNDWSTYSTQCKVFPSISSCSLMVFVINPSTKEYIDNYTGGSNNLIAIGKWK